MIYPRSALKSVWFAKAKSAHKKTRLPEANAYPFFRNFPVRGALSSLQRPIYFDMAMMVTAKVNTIFAEVKHYMTLKFPKKLCSL